MKKMHAKLTKFQHAGFLCLLLVSLPALIVHCAEEKGATPLELSSGKSLTSREAMMSFLRELERKTNRFSLETVASSVEGRDIVMLRFPALILKDENRDEIITILVSAQQHGDEPAGKEALIQLARDAAFDEQGMLTHNIQLLIIPQVNPDGAYRQQRGNARGVDLARNHLTVTEPETAGLHKVFQQYQPEVVLDIQEYNLVNQAWSLAGYQKDFGIQMATGTNPNISIALRRFAWNSVFPAMADALRSENIRFQRYLVADDPGKQFRYGSTAIDNGRNSFGIWNTLSFVLAGPKSWTPSERIGERTAHLEESLKVFLRFFSQKATPVKRLVQQEREKMVQGSEWLNVNIKMDYVKDPANPSVTVPLRLLADETEVEKTFENFYPLVQPTASVIRPLGYAIPPDRKEILEVLKRHNIAAQLSEEPTRAVLEKYAITSIAPGTVEGRGVRDVAFSVRSMLSTIPAGYYIVWCNQLQAAQIVTLLEPGSVWGLAQQPRFSRLLSTDALYPVMRIMRIVE